MVEVRMFEKKPSSSPPPPPPSSSRGIKGRRRGIRGRRRMWVIEAEGRDAAIHGLGQFANQKKERKTQDIPQNGLSPPTKRAPS